MTTDTKTSEEEAHGKTIVDDALMVFLSLISVFLLFFEVLSAHSPQQMRALDAADLVIAIIFFGEFWIRFFKAGDKKLFLRKHWWELLASIPIPSTTTQALRGLNVLRLIRVIRLLRLLRLKVVLAASSRFTEKTHLIYISVVAGLVLMSAALGFHYMEAGVNPNVHSLWDSFWWTVVTITTVGYGDIYPVTTGGRIIAIFLMLGGIACFSAITATISAYIISKQKK